MGYLPALLRSFRRVLKSGFASAQTQLNQLVLSSPATLNTLSMKTPNYRSTANLHLNDPAASAQSAGLPPA